MGGSKSQSTTVTLLHCPDMSDTRPHPRPRRSLGQLRGRMSQARQGRRGWLGDAGGWMACTLVSEASSRIRWQGWCWRERTGEVSWSREEVVFKSPVHAMLCGCFQEERSVLQRPLYSPIRKWHGTGWLRRGGEEYCSCRAILSTSCVRRHHPSTLFSPESGERRSSGSGWGGSVEVRK